MEIFQRWLGAHSSRAKKLANLLFERGVLAERPSVETWCFVVPLVAGYKLSISVPVDTDSLRASFCETCLMFEQDHIYRESLGYEDTKRLFGKNLDELATKVEAEIATLKRALAPVEPTAAPSSAEIGPSEYQMH